MSAETSHWIPRRRIRIAVSLALSVAAAGLVGSFWSHAALVLLLPGLGASYAAFVMLRIRAQLSPSGGGWERRIHERVVARLALSSEAQLSVLDIGCGSGSLIAAIAEHSPRVVATGVDFWDERWQYAQTACEERLQRLGRCATFRRMDAAQLDFPDDHFDLVVSVMCFHEVQAPPGAALRGPLLALSEALRVLRPGGAFVLVDRFGDAADFGGEAALAAVLQPASEVHRESVVKALGVPWPLSSRRALGPALLLSGRKRA